MTTAELQTSLDAGGDLPPGDFYQDEPLFVKGVVRGSNTTMHTNNFDSLIALPDALRFHDPVPYFSADTYRTLGHSCIRFLNTPGDWVQGQDKLMLSMRLTRYNNGGAIMGLAGNKKTGGDENFPPSPWLLHTHPDWPGSVALHMLLATGARHTLRWKLNNIGVEQSVFISADLATGTVVLAADGTPIGAITGTMPPAGSKFADNETSALFLGAVTNQGSSLSEWGCCDCSMRDVSITYNGSPFTPYIEPPALGHPVIPYNGGYGLFLPTGLNDWTKGVEFHNISFSGQRWGAAITAQSGLRTRIQNIKSQKFAVPVQVLGGPLPNYPVNIQNIYGYKPYDCLVRLQRCSMGVIRDLYAEYPVRSVLRADICGMVTVRDVFQAPEGDHTVADSMRFDRCCHMDLARLDFNYEDNVGPKNSYIRVVGDPSDISPPPYLGFTHIVGKYKGIDLTGSPWGQPGYPISFINTSLPVRYNQV